MSKPKVKIKLESAGIKNFLKSNHISSHIEGYANRIRGRCGAGYAIHKNYTKSRIRYAVVAETDAAKLDNLRNNTLQKARRA